MHAPRPLLLSFTADDQAGLCFAAGALMAARDMGLLSRVRIVSATGPAVPLAHWLLRAREQTSRSYFRAKHTTDERTLREAEWQRLFAPLTSRSDPDVLRCEVLEAAMRHRTPPSRRTSWCEWVHRWLGTRNTAADSVAPRPWYDQRRIEPACHQPLVVLCTGQDTYVTNASPLADDANWSSERGILLDRGASTLQPGRLDACAALASDPLATHGCLLWAERLGHRCHRSLLLIDGRRRGRTAAHGRLLSTLFNRDWCEHDGIPVGDSVAELRRAANMGYLSALNAWLHPRALSSMLPPRCMWPFGYEPQTEDLLGLCIGADATVAGDPACVSRATRPPPPTRERADLTLTVDAASGWKQRLEAWLPDSGAEDHPATPRAPSTSPETECAPLVEHA